ncbi:MAG: glycosyltransferase family 39 protein [Armatimonadota bacterium]
MPPVPGRFRHFAPHAMILVGAILRLIHGSRTGLSNDEAYYWCWSRHLDYWYYDQGPAIAWCLRAVTAVLGDSVLGVRACPILFGTGTLLFLTAFLRRTLGDRIALWAVLLASAAPLLSTGGTIATYDAPQVFFWAAALWAFEKAACGSIPYWYVTAAACFLGNLSKIPMVFFPLGALLACAVHPPWRRWLRTPHPWIAGALSLASLSAMVLWNARHDNLYVLHTANLGRRTMSAAPGRWLLDFVAGQALALGPGLWFAEIAACATFLRRSTSAGTGPWPRVLWVFVVPMLGVCLVNSLRSKVEINWPVSAHLAGVAAAAWWADLHWAAGRRGRVIAAVVPSLVIQLFAWFPNAASLVGVRIPARTVSKLTETRGWDHLAGRIESERVRMESESGMRPLLASTNYKATAMLSFIGADQREATCLFPGTRRNQFLLWPSARGAIGADYLVAVDHDPTPFLPYFHQWFDRVDTVIPVPIHDSAFDGPIKQWFLVPCHGFRGADSNRTAIGY